jgi:nitrous oxidase accessory protein
VKLRVLLAPLLVALASVRGGAAFAASGAVSTSDADQSQSEGGPRELAVPGGAVVAKTFDELAAIVKDAGGPRDVWLEPKTYTGDLIIERPVAIHGAKGATLEGTGHSTVVTVKADDVLLENLYLRRSGHRHTTEDSAIKATGTRIRIADVRTDDTLFGISLEACKHCTLERAHVEGYGDDQELRGDGVKLWEADDSVVRDTVVSHSRDVVVWYTRRALLEHNIVRHGRYGSHFMYTHDCTVRRSHVEGNVVGIFVMYSGRLTVEDNVLAGARGAAGVGIGFKESDSITVRRNWLVANTTGTYLDNTPRTEEEPVTFEGNVIALNEVGVRMHGAEKGVHFVGNDLRDNALMLEVDGGGNALGADFHGNYYSDYEGYDLDGDGVGDVAYEVKTLSAELTDAHEDLKFFHGTTAMSLVDAIAHAVPVLAAKQLMTDPKPLARRPAIVEPRR